MTELTLKLVIIFIPGAIATLIFGKLILHKEWTNFRFVLISVIFGLFSYLFLQLIILLINLFLENEINDLTLWNTLSDVKSIPYKEVLFSSIISIILAFIVSLMENKKWIYKLARLLKISNKYGEENLYSRFLNDPNTDYIYLRDIKNNLTYHGWVKSFSESTDVTEIRLSEVTVYTYSESDHLYDIDEVYLSLNKSEIIIEKAINE